MILSNVDCLPWLPCKIHATTVPFHFCALVNSCSGSSSSTSTTSGSSASTNGDRWGNAICSNGHDHGYNLRDEDVMQVHSLRPPGQPDWLDLFVHFCHLFCAAQDQERFGIHRCQLQAPARRVHRQMLLKPVPIAHAEQYAAWPRPHSI